MFINNKLLNIRFTRLTSHKVILRQNRFKIIVPKRMREYYVLNENNCLCAQLNNDIECKPEPTRRIEINNLYIVGTRVRIF